MHGLQLLDVGGSVDAEQGILRGERHRDFGPFVWTTTAGGGGPTGFPGGPYGPTGRFTLA